MYIIELGSNRHWSLVDSIAWRFRTVIKKIKKIFLIIIFSLYLLSTQKKKRKVKKYEI